QQIGRLAPQYGGYAVLVAVDLTLEGTVEPAEKAALFVGMALGNGFEDGGTQGRGEDQRNQYRQRHCRGDGNGELTVDHPGGTAEEGHGHEYRGQHQAD